MRGRGGGRKEDRGHGIMDGKNVDYEWRQFGEWFLIAIGKA